MKYRFRPSLLLAACVGLVVLAAPVAAESSADAPRASRSPLAEYPGFGHDDAADEARYEREEAARERLVAECMERQGFRYVPSPSLALDDFESPTAAMAALRDDPNDRYRLGLDDAARARYDVALWGTADPYSEDAADQPDPEDAAAGGCRGEALRALPGVFAAKAALQDEVMAMRRAVMDDPRLLAAEQQWAACMRERGHRGDASPRALEQRQDEELARFVGDAREADLDRAALGALGARHQGERELTMECAKAVDLPGVVAAIRVDLETQFVRAHRDTLERHLQSLHDQESLLEEQAR